MDPLTAGSPLGTARALAQRLASATGVEEAVVLLLAEIHGRWSCRATALALPSGTAHEPEQVFCRGVERLPAVRLAPGAAWDALLQRFPELTRAAFLWVPLASGTSGGGSLVLAREAAEAWTDAEREEIALAAQVAGTVLTQLRRAEGATRLLDRLAGRLHAADTELSNLQRTLGLLSLNPFAEALPLLAREIHRLVRFDWLQVFTWVEDGSDARAVPALDGAGTALPGPLLPTPTDSLLAAVRRDGYSVRWNDIGADAEPPDLAALAHAGYRSALLEPLRYRGRCLGALYLAGRTSHLFSAHDGNLLGPIATLLGATLTQEADVARARAETRAWERLLEALPDGVLALDHADRLLLVNARAQQILGLPPGTLDHLRGTLLTDCLSELAATSQSGGRLRLGGADYTVLRVSAHAPAPPALPASAPIAGARPGAMLLLRAAPPAVKSELELQQEERLSLLGQLIAGIAHELNNPLSAVIGFASLLRGTTGDDRVLRRLAALDEGAVRCREIVQGLLSFARHHPVQHELVALAGVIERTVALLRYQLCVSNVTVETSIEPNTPLVEADEHQLQQALLNLVVNAFHAIAEARAGGTIWIAARRLGDQALLEVADNGPGIPAVVRARLFEPFVTTKPEGKGTGLGLSITRRIVESNRGTIAVADRPGGGTVFTLCFPEAQARLLRTVGSRQMQAPALPPSRILVVDDEAAVRDLVVGVLEHAGGTLRAATGGRAAIAALESESFDLVVCDLRMPQCDGPEVYAWVRGHRPALLPRFLFTTGDTLNEGAQVFLRETGVDCLPKPFELAELVRRAGKILTEHPPGLNPATCSGTATST